MVDCLAKKANDAGKYIAQNKIEEIVDRLFSECNPDPDNHGFYKIDNFVQEYIKAKD